MAVIMKNSNFCLSSFSVLLLLACTAFAQPPISYNDLHTRPVENIPQKVRVTDMLTTHGNAATDGFVHILEQVPESWEYIGAGRLSISIPAAAAAPAMITRLMPVMVSLLP